MTRPTLTGDPGMLRAIRVWGRVLQVAIGAGLVGTVIVAVRHPDGGSVTGAALTAVAYLICVANNRSAGFGLTWANHIARTR